MSKTRLPLIFIVCTIMLVLGFYGIHRIMDARGLSLLYGKPVQDNQSGKYGGDANQGNNASIRPQRGNIINPDGSTIQERFMTPEGFERVPVQQGSFGKYLRNLPLKPHSSKVRYYDGRIKPRDVYEAVIDMDIGDRDLQQCADAVMRLRAEYLYGKGFYDKIHFNFTNGFRADYSVWMRGNRIIVEGNKVYWVEKAGFSDSYGAFMQYMEMVFAYAGTLSLSKELESVPVDEMRIGDVFIKGGTPGHCVIVVDMAVNRATGEKLFMIAQSYMPAQDIHILKNENHIAVSPWYSTDFGEVLQTPEWTFDREQLMRFRE